MSTLTTHWDKVFQNTAEEKLGWHENDYSQTLRLLNLIPGWKGSSIFVSGVGTSGLVDELSEANTKLILNDISPAAIEKVKRRLGDKEHTVRWLCQDISAPLPADLLDLDIWIDRAVLHFLTSDAHIEGYFTNLHNAVKPEGHVLLAEFSKTGAKRCAGLDVRQYNLEEFKQRLPGFELITSEAYTYTNPNGDPRPYIYALFKRDS